MNKFIKQPFQMILVIFTLGIFSSCEEFFNPDQEITITEDQLYNDWYEYRAAILGLYALQQDLVGQLVVLGELRGDLLTVTDNADADLREVNNFNVSKTNKYSSPQNFFKLIAATNRFISIIEREQPNVSDLSKPVNNYDRIYGEALCIRAWTYFNASRIYGKVPFIDERLTTIEEINEFINSPSTYTDSVYIEYSIDGYYNDTIYNQKVTLEKQYFDLERVIRHFTNELESKVKVVGVNHYIENDDNTWEVTIWSNWGYHALLGHMYLTLGELTQSAHHFEMVVNNGTENDQFQLTEAFANGNWRNIFAYIDSREHIFTLWFNKANQQQNDLQRLFEPYGPNDYMIKPTRACVHKWETEWTGADVPNDTIPANLKNLKPGIPNDRHRGFGHSYQYVRNQVNLDGALFNKMLIHKMHGEERSVETIMENIDTVVYKYSIGRGVFDQDPNFIVYRAAGVNLYLGEIYNYLNFIDASGVVRSNSLRALNIVNDGSYYDVATNRTQKGVRGRVELPGYTIKNIVYEFDPFTNEVIGWQNLSNNLLAKQYRFENQIMDERARELAFEGERFYDLMRVAKRRGDPSYLASRVSEKYPPGQRQQIYNHLLNEDNWYIHYFD